MPGMVKVVLDEEGIWTADIGHIVEEAVPNLYPDPEVDPYKAAARRVYEEWLAEEELRQLEEEDPGFAEYLKQSHAGAFDLLRAACATRTDPTSGRWDGPSRHLPEP